MEKNQKELVKIVVIRAVFGKLTEEAKLKKLDVGEVVSMQRKYADELISIRKALEVDTPAHEAWIEQEKSRAAAKKAEQKPTANEKKLIEKVAELEAQLAEVTKPKK
jgi:hypothetical protein